MAEEKFNTGTPRIYYKTKREEGKNFALWKYSKTSEHNPFEIEVVNKRGERGYNIPVRAISGVLKDIVMKHNEHEGQQYTTYDFILTDVNDDGEPVELVLSASYGSKYANHIIASLPNCDLKKPIRLMPYVMPKEGTDKYNSGTTVYQGTDAAGKPIKVARYYDIVKNAQGIYEAINGLPQPIKKKLGGKEKWDFDDQNEFLENYVMNKVRAELLNLHTQNVQQFAPPPQAQQKQQTAPQGKMQEVKMTANSYDNVPPTTDEFVPEDIDDLPF